MPKDKGQAAAGSGIKIIAENKKARFNYHILEKVEAGIVLTGAEIKSIRQNGISLSESYIGHRGNELFLVNAHIAPYSHGSPRDYDPLRSRKLLLHRREIDRLRGRMETKGLTSVPLKVYLKNGRAKVEVALAKGKLAPDKRQSIKERESRRELARAVKGG